jgi:hypothetical protein
VSAAFVDNSTYERVIGDTPTTRTFTSPDVERFEVELSPLDAGDRAKIRDALAIEAATTATPGIALGTAWRSCTCGKPSSPGRSAIAPTPATIDRLKPAALEAIRGLIAWGTIPPTPPTKAEQDATPPPSSSAGAREATERHIAALEDDELRDEEPEGRVPLASSAGGAGDGC